MKDLNERLFQEEIRIFTVEILAEGLELLVEAGFRFTQTGVLPPDILNQRLKMKAEPAVKEIQQMLDPEEFKKVREMNPLDVWKIYWNLRNAPTHPRVSFLRFLLTVTHSE